MNKCILKKEQEKQDRAQIYIAADRTLQLPSFNTFTFY